MAAPHRLIYILLRPLRLGSLPSPSQPSSRLHHNQRKGKVMFCCCWISTFQVNIFMSFLSKGRHCAVHVSLSIPTNTLTPHFFIPKYLKVNVVSQLNFHLIIH